MLGQPVLPPSEIAEQQLGVEGSAEVILEESSDLVHPDNLIPVDKPTETTEEPQFTWSEQNGVGISGAEQQGMSGERSGAMAGGAEMAPPPLTPERMAEIEKGVIEDLSGDGMTNDMVDAKDEGKKVGAGVQEHVMAAKEDLKKLENPHDKFEAWQSNVWKALSAWFGREKGEGR